MNEYKAYLFDMDGTLVNSEPLKGKALALACRDYDADVDFNIYKDVMGESWAVVTGHFFKAANISPSVDEFNRYFRKHYEELLNVQLELTPKAAQYIDSLLSKGIRCGVVSSAATWMVDQILEQLGLQNKFDVVITQEHVTRHKPDPEAYNMAIAMLGLENANVLVFEDSTAGITAGIQSGCDVVAIRHEFNDQNDLSLAKLVIDDFGELLV